jgi:rhodanese-related sulfurtransferase
MAESRSRSSRAGAPPRPERGADAVEANRRWFEAKLAAQRQLTDVVHKVKGDVELPDSDFLLLDARGRDAYAKAHIPGALCVPIREVDAIASKLPHDKELVTYCWSDH